MLVLQSNTAMKKIYFLSSCSTCVRIIKDLKITTEHFEMQDIKNEKITPKQLEEMKKLSGSFESLFSRIALKYRSMKLGEQTLNEKDYQKLILSEYTFLKRPVFLINNKIFIGNSPKNIQAVKEILEHE